MSSLLPWLPEHEQILDARTLSQQIDPARTALLIIDAQVDFIAPEGAMGRIGLDLSAVPAALTRVQKLITTARDSGVTPVFIRVVTHEQTDTSALINLTLRKGRPRQAIGICRAGSVGADYHGIAPRDGDLEVEKIKYSSFYGTDLEATLKARGIDTLLLCGFTTDCCVDCTAREGFHLNFNVYLVEDACAAFDRGLHEGAIRGLTKNCALATDTDTVMAALAIPAAMV